MALLSSMEDIDFRFLKRYIGLSQGNLSSHIRRLEKAGYVKVERGLLGRYPGWRYGLQKRGRGSMRDIGEVGGIFEGVQVGKRFDMD